MRPYQCGTNQSVNQSYICRMQSIENSCQTFTGTDALLGLLLHLFISSPAAAAPPEAQAEATAVAPTEQAITVPPEAAAYPPPTAESAAAAAAAAAAAGAAAEAAAAAAGTPLLDATSEFQHTSVAEPAAGA
jgi:hypothetical protein